MIKTSICRNCCFFIALLLFIFCGSANSQVKTYLEDNALVVKSTNKKYIFTGEFSVLFSKHNPSLALRSAGVKGVLYNVPTWKAESPKKADLKKSKIGNDMVGDGFDDDILKGNQDNRTSNLFNAGELSIVQPIKTVNKSDSIIFSYPENEFYSLTAKMIILKNGYPKIDFTLVPKQKGYFSVGYTGAPEMDPDATEEIWQPLIWQEKRFPDNAYLTPSFMATLPTAMVNDGLNSIGVLASPEFLPFNPLPVFTNSQFGISVRDRNGNAKPQVFAPIFGSKSSLMNVGSSFSFNAYLVVEPRNITYTYEKIARKYFGFKDYRKNDISTLNSAFDNIVDFSLSKYAYFVDSLKGFAYSTDVPGAVKNVSSLNPIELALVTDSKKIFDSRAYPLLEYMLSREKFLFALDSTQKIQSPSRKLRGPIAPISELSSLSSIFGDSNSFYLTLAKQEYDTSRIRNLDVAEKGDTWMTSLYMYKANRKKQYLQKAIEGANDYLLNRVYQKQTAFDDQFAGQFFFWPSYTNRWIDLLELYEVTKDEKYLNAAHEGARHYAMFTWMAPKIPHDSLVTVNPKGKAPYYGYLKSKGFPQMSFAEEKAPTWRLSEIGLTPESSGTSTGHRAIFMANYAPWMLRLGYYKKDTFLTQIAKAAIIGRYRNFPGYHINTARTTAYEKFDFPLHKHNEQSVNSFHYNHIMPMATILLDYLVTDAYVRSNGEVNFPSQFIEGYAYLQSKFYGASPGKVYNEEGVYLWMPKNLLTTESVELNYISSRKGKDVFISFMNQSNKTVKSKVFFNESLLQNLKKAKINIYKNNEWKRVGRGDLIVEVAANGITTVKLENAMPAVQIQDKILSQLPQTNSDYVKLDFGKAEAMLIHLGHYANRAYIYLKDDDSVFSEVTVSYQVNNGETQVITKRKYPFEFTIDLPLENPKLSFKLSGIKINGERVESNTETLGY